MCAKAVDYLNAAIPKIDEALLKAVRKDDGPREVYGLIEEFLKRGGKRVRPALCLLSCEAVGGKLEQALPAATALELFHSFCLAGDAKITTNPGEMKPISSISEGETVYTFDSSTGSISRNKVLKRFENGVKKTFELKTRNRSITATANHPFLVARKKHPSLAYLTPLGVQAIKQALKKNCISWLQLSKKLCLKSTARNWLCPGKLIPKESLEQVCAQLSIHLSSSEAKFRPSNIGVFLELEWVPLEKLRKGDLLVVATNLPDDGREHPLPESPQGNFKKSVSFPKTTTRDFCQIAGMFFGDGCLLINKKIKCVTLCLPEKDEARNAYIELVKKVFNVEPRLERDSISIPSAQVALVFESMGLKGKALDKKIPEWVFKLPRTHKLAFLKGLLDSDGTVNKRGTAVFSSASWQLIEGVKMLLDSTGFTAGHVKSKVVKNLFACAKKKTSTIFEVEASNPAKVGLEIGSECKTKSSRLQAKGRCYNFKHVRTAPNGGIDFRFFGLNPVTSIKELGEQAVYDIMVENNHNFIANGVVVHNSLVHDDLEDDSELRRGKPCLHKLHGAPLAINAGDGLFVLVWKALQSLELPAKKQIAVSAMLTQAFTRVLEGQAIELNWRRENNWSLRAEDYYNMAGGKTGALIAASCEVGGFAGGAKKRQLKALRAYGEAIGLAFQIQDDVLNLVGEEEKYQKEIGGDVTEGKRSLASIRALEKLGGEEKATLLKILSSNTRDENEISKAIELMKKSGAVEYASDEAVRLIEKAKKSLNALPASDSRETLESFADYFISRES